MVVKRSASEEVFNVLNILFMIFMMIITLYPFMYVIFASLSNPNDLMGHTGLLFKPLGFSVASYKFVLNYPSVLIGYRNTALLLILGVSTNILLTCLGAYFLSRKSVALRNPIMMMVVFTMYFSGGMIPIFLLVKGIGIYNSIFALILPKAIHTTNLIIMRTAFLAVPDSLEESARIDGAKDFTILFRIMIPLTMPTVAVLVLYYGVAHWNAWFDAAIYLQNTKLWPLQLVLRQILIQSDTSFTQIGQDRSDAQAIGENMKYALIIVATLPILSLYPFLQRYFVKGVMIGSVKG